MRRFALWIPLVLVLVLTSLVFLAARAPRTWAAHWSNPRVVATGAGQNEYGAAYDKGGWDILRYNDDPGDLILSLPTGKGPVRSLTLDRGDITQPTLLRLTTGEVAAWVHNHNGSTDLMAANIESDGSSRTFPLAGGKWPIEHPYLFAGPGGAADLVFSWQRYGNFDVFLLSLRPGRTRASFIRRLTHAGSYAFYPRAVVDRSGALDLLYLDACCRGHAWRVMLDRYDRTGLRLEKTQTLETLGSPGGSTSTPTQWAEDIRVDATGHVVGAYAADSGIQVFRSLGAGIERLQSLSLDPLPGTPASLALAVGPRVDYLFWEQPFDLGTYLTGRRFAPTLDRAQPPERVVYEASAQTGIHAVRRGSSVRVLWQAITPSLRSTFQTATSTSTRLPDLAQRLGLGLGNPLEALAVLVVVGTGVAIITTMGNVLTIIGYVLAALLVMRVLGRTPARWTIFSAVLTMALALTFVWPGGPILFLETLPQTGFPVVPFGMIAIGAVFLLLTWLGDLVLRGVEDLFRIALLTAAGVYFFAFLEALVFVQQRLGYI